MVSPFERALSKFMITEDCWPWVGSRTDGYGRLRGGRGNVLAHRLLYETLVGNIPEGRVLDHLCRNRACVRPSHLEVVTNRENGLRGIGPQAEHARKTHCIYGHEFTAENTLLHQRSYGISRVCRVCKHRRHAATQRRARDRRRSALPSGVAVPA